MMKQLKKIYVRLRNLLGYTFVNFLYFIRKKRGFSNIDNNISFHKKGICKIYLNGISEKMEKLLSNKSNEYFKTSEIIKNEFGIKVSSIDLNSKVLWDYVFNDKLFEIINSHFKGKFYLRNLPTINFSYDGEINNAQLFHNDWGLRQLAVMINLMDLDEKNTHMEYIEKSNKKYFFQHPVRFSEKFKTYIKKEMKKNKVAKTTGKADSTFMFDAGNGLHRQVSGGKRIIIHLNFTDSFVHSDWSKNWLPERTLNDYWFQKNVDNILLEKINNSPFSIKNFSMVLRNVKPGFFKPKIYSLNSKSIK